MERPYKARRGRNADGTSFDKFKQLMTNFPSGHMAVMSKFMEFLQSGCTEAEAKQWIMLHISEFPEPLRGTVMAEFAKETLRQTEEEEMDRQFMRIWDTQGFYAAMDWMKQQRALRARKGQ